jgi:hypothetical protein
LNKRYTRAEERRIVRKRRVEYSRKGSALRTRKSYAAEELGTGRGIALADQRGSRCFRLRMCLAQGKGREASDVYRTYCIVPWAPASTRVSMTGR